MNTGSLPSAPPLAVPIHPSNPSVTLLQKMEERITFLEKQTSAKQTVGNSTTVQFEGQLFNRIWRTVSSPLAVPHLFQSLSLTTVIPCYKQWYCRSKATPSTSGRSIQLAKWGQMSVRLTLGMPSQVIRTVYLLSSRAPPSPPASTRVRV